MRDLLLIVPTEENASWNIDIDIIDGQPVLVPSERNTQDQRAAVAAFTVKGTIPGMPSEGIDWDKLYTQGATVLQIDNEVKQAIQNKAAIPSTANTTYIPMYSVGESSIKMGIYQTQ